MTTLIARVLLTIAFLVIASAQTCTLCPNGEKPRNGKVVVGQFGIDLVTCEEYVQAFTANSDGSCGDYLTHAFQVVCGCPRVKAGSCPGICDTGSILDQPDIPTSSGGVTCSLFDQIVRGTPGDSTCSDSGNIYNQLCKCKVKVKPGQNMGSGVGGNGGTGNPGTGMMGMSGGRQLRLGGFEERFPPRAARGLDM